MTPTLVTEDVELLEAGKPYVHSCRPQPFTVTVTGYYAVYVSRRGHFMTQRVDPTRPLVRCA